MVIFVLWLQHIFPKAFLRVRKGLKKLVQTGIYTKSGFFFLSSLLFSGPGWLQLDPVVAAELLSQIQEGEFWVEEEEFFVEFDEIITGYPITEEGQLQSLYTGMRCPERGHLS